jgi:hypothetical protein
MSSTYSQGSAASPSGSNEPECEPSRSARSTPSADVSSPSTGPTSPVTTTCEVLPLTGSQQMELLPMSSVAASPARTSAPLESKQELMQRDPAYGQKSSGLLATYDRASSSWKTSQTSLLALPSSQGLGLEEFSETWPRSGSMRNGIAFRLPPLAPRTEETEFGLWPTPQTQYDGRSEEAWVAAKARADHKRRTGQYAKGCGTPSMVDLQRAARMFPTPRASDGERGGRGDLLASIRGYKTQRAHWPTPTASRRSGLQSHGKNALLGVLNPRWVEWLMMFPTAWLSLNSAPLATPSSRKSRKSSGGQS